MHDLERMRHALHRLKRLGVGLAIDDFGTGQSSLTHLQRFPTDLVKVDKSFVQGLGDDAETGVRGAIATAVIGMAHALGKTVAAEGVETEGQLHVLRRLQCEVAQGFLFSPWVDAGRFTELLADGQPLR